jgi:Transposase DDE domain
MPPPYTRHKKTLELINGIAQRCCHRAPHLRTQAQSLQQELKKVLRSFGRQCRGQGRVFVKLVRQTERQLLALGAPIPALGQQAQQLLAQAHALNEAQRERLAAELTAALGAHEHIRTQSGRLTQGKKLTHWKIVNAYDPTIAPIIKGKSNCPAQFGRKPGLVSDPATGFIFANCVPKGNPSDSSYGLPLLDKVQSAIDRVSAPQRLQVHSVAGDLGVNDTALRQALHARGILTIGIPKTVEPINPTPTPEEILAILNEAGLNRKRTPHQVQLACACGYSRPVVESHIASLLSRGAGQVRYKGLQGAVIQQGMTVMAHNGATLVRIRQRRLSKRAQKFRRLLGLRHRKINQINDQKN